MCQMNEVVLSSIPFELLSLLNHYASVCDPSLALPPLRNIDHAICLVPNAYPINLRPY
jgi:hypothetical protein